MAFRTPNSSETNTLRGISLPIPSHDYQAFTYVAAGVTDDDDVASITFYVGGVSGTVVGRHVFTYVGGTNNIATAKFEVSV